jgi:hypothetical protein
MSATVRQSPNDRATPEMLAQWRGGRAKVWDYTPSLARLTLRVESGVRPGNLHVVCGGCKHIRGPFHWAASSFEVVPADDSGLILRDAAADFEVRCQVVGLQENVDPVYAPTVLAPSA